MWQTLFLDECQAKYPLAEGELYPSCPMDYTKELSEEDLEDQAVLLNAKEITEFQALLGDCLWITMHTKPNVKYPVNFASRTVSPAPTLYDYLQALRIMHYCIGTKGVPRRIGGKFGAVLTATVDSSFASHKDLKGQSCYTIHMGGGGAVAMDTKKQTLTPQSSTESEIYGNVFMLPKLIWSRNVCYELSYDQRSVMPKGTPVGKDNTSTMRIISNEVNTGKTKHMNLRLQALREALKEGVFQMFHLPTKDMISDIGTKALPPGMFTHLSNYILGITTLDHFLQFFPSELLKQ